MMVMMMAVPALADEGDTNPDSGTTTEGGTTEGGTTEGGNTEGGTTTTPYDNPLTVTGLAKDDVVKFYKVIEWVGETNDHSDVSGWKAVAPFDTYLNKTKLTEILIGIKDDPDTEADEKKDPTGITSDIAGELAKLASGDGVAPTTQTDDTATLNNTESGMWMALVTLPTLTRSTILCLCLLTTIMIRLAPLP